MLKVGVTGGIGSGKSVVCRVFHTLGIPVFNADDTARYLMQNDAILMQQIKELLGANVYQEAILDRAKVSEIIFREPEKLERLNALVHPATVAYADRWFEQQKTSYVIKEAAIFFESGSYREMDVMIGVFAPRELRIERAMKRSGMIREKVLSIMAHQMDENEKMSRCDHVITNDDLQPILPQVLKLNELFIPTAN